MGIYENRNLEKWKIEIWKITNFENANFEKCIFGKMQLKKNADLEIWKSQEMKIGKKWVLVKKKL